VQDYHQKQQKADEEYTVGEKSSDATQKDAQVKADGVEAEPVLLLLYISSRRTLLYLHWENSLTAPIRHHRLRYHLFLVMTEIGFSFRAAIVEGHLEHISKWAISLFLNLK
jgi:hypothetical protein